MRYFPSQLRFWGQISRRGAELSNSDNKSRIHCMDTQQPSSISSILLHILDLVRDKQIWLMFCFTEEGDMEGIIPSASNTGTETGTLVEVKFQKKTYQIQKYLEAEPKALGVTQIMLSLLFLSLVYLNWNYYFSNTSVIVSSCFSSTSIIAGSVAIAAQNLHLPTLKACLGMQVVACVFSVFSFLITSSQLPEHFFVYYCWEHNYNGTLGKNMCERLWSIYEHVTGIEMLVQVAQIALSATLAAFCCKIIQCCTPKSNVPVIVVNAPPGPQ